MVGIGGQDRLLKTFNVLVSLSHPVPAIGPTMVEPGENFSKRRFLECWKMPHVFFIRNLDRHLVLKASYFDVKVLTFYQNSSYCLIVEHFWVDITAQRQEKCPSRSKKQVAVFSKERSYKSSFQFFIADGLFSLSGLQWAVYIRNKS